jgi:hypothetical protein
MAAKDYELAQLAARARHSPQSIKSEETATATAPVPEIIVTPIAYFPERWFYWSRPVALDGTS